MKVKDIAKQYGVPSRTVLEELAGQGIETPDAENSIIPEDMVELVESYFADLFEAEETAMPKSNRKGGAPKKGTSRKDDSHNRRQSSAPAGRSGREQQSSSSAVVDGKLTLRLSSNGFV